MKKYIIVFMVFLLVGCSGRPDEVEVEVKIYEMQAILQTAGYEMEQKGYATVFDYNRKQIEQTYDLELDLFELFYGYRDSEEEELYMVCFADTDDAISYYDAIMEEPDLTEFKFIYQEGQVVIVAQFEDAISIFK